MGPSAKWLLLLSMIFVNGVVYADRVAASTSSAGATSTACGAGSVTPTQLERVLTTLIELVNGPVAKSLAILAVIGFGVAALSGKVEWTRAMIVVLGVGIVFSASTLVTLFCS